MRMRHAFSLIEVIFVLVILGIVASISSQIIAQVYENYLNQRAMYNVSTKTELVANQMVNLLSYRIQGTTISKDHDYFVNNPAGPATYDTHWKEIKYVDVAGTQYTSIEWIGYDNDSFSAAQIPAWSGVADYQSPLTNINRFLTPGSQLSSAATILNHLSETQVDLVNTPAAVLFAHPENYYDDGLEYNPLCMGLIPQDTGSSTNCIYPVVMDNNDTLRFTRLNEDKYITERYKMAWSAYAIAPEDTGRLGNDNQPLFNLYLYSNYQPWSGDNYLSQDTTKNLLMTNVSVFKFSENGGVIRFKICAQEDIGQRQSDGTPINISVCKEKAVIR